MLSDHTKFRCSETFVQKYITNNLDWSWHTSTRAAGKLPDDVEKVLEEAFLREAWVIREYNIPAELRINTDQTQTVYQQGTKATWEKQGAKQVPVVGIDEKRAFTLVPSISASGEVLPFQAVFSGKTDVSLPGHDSEFFEEARKLGFQFLPSGGDLYWSTLETMKTLVNDIIAPYFKRKKVELKIDGPSEQFSLWKIDCWSVHKSEAFLSWMKATHPKIIILFVPGNCT
ncbi:hypothetical protein K435DRAFT_705496, partial [Dendrothele bispora CBS 962.96]